tara:strand:- start:1372 stop:1587 length:216 start_codon:yes stop_codon:yes gene_type:complete
MKKTDENVAAPSMNTSAVPGAGDDSSTVVVRKKKKKKGPGHYEEIIAVDRRLKDQSQPRLLKRFRKFAEEN